MLELERPYNPGLTIDDIPVDAVTTSGSGHRPPDLAGLRARSSRARIAAVRKLPLATVQTLIHRAHRRSLRSGFFGEPGVNVLELNLALDNGERETA